MRKLHATTGIAAFAIVLVFWSSTILSEIAGDTRLVVTVKTAILWGMLLLVPALATAALTGRRMMGRALRPQVRAKARRMPVIAGNGILVLVPCAALLQSWASAGRFDGAFVFVQGVELLAGAVNLTLLGLNIRDGFALRRRPGSLRNAPAN